MCGLFFLLRILGISKQPRKFASYLFAHTRLFSEQFQRNTLIHTDVNIQTYLSSTQNTILVR